jgi:hypothetical protein
MDFCEALWNRYAETPKKAGRDVPREEIGAWGGFLILADSKEQAKQLEAEHRWFWDKWFIPHGQQFPNVLIGTADDISRQIEQAHDRLGFNECARSAKSWGSHDLSRWTSRSSTARSRRRGGAGG